MDNKVELICIVCPIGCHLEVSIMENGEYNVTGNTCIRGVHYAKKELTNPTRVVTSTVSISNGTLGRLPVKTNGDIPKKVIFDAMTIINDVRIQAPIKCGDIIVKDILNTGIDIVASRSMPKNTS